MSPAITYRKFLGSELQNAGEIYLRLYPMLPHNMAKMIFEQASRRYYIWMWESIKFNYLDLMFISWSLSFCMIFVWPES